MIRAVFFDLDGTLLSPEKTIPESACQAILRCRERGTRIFFASARSPRLDQTLDWTDREFTLFDGGIYSNGACVQLDGDFFYHYIAPEAVRFCVEQAAKYEGVHLSLHMPGGSYAFNFAADESMNKGWGLDGVQIVPIDEQAIGRCAKLLMFYDHLTDSQRPLPEQLRLRIQQVCGQMAHVYITDQNRTIQLAGKEAGKLRAIEAIRKKLGFEAEEVSVFGDDINDLEMISFYPNSVAMGNAVDPVKWAAGFVIGSNDQDGVAYALEHLRKIF